MTLEDLVKYLRFEILDDYVTGWEAISEYDSDSQLLWSNESLTRYINEAEVQACRRSLLLKDFDNYKFNVVAGKTVYELDSKILRIKDIDSTNSGFPLSPIEYEEVRGIQNWRTKTGTPEYYIFDYNPGEIRIYPTPVEADTLNLTVYRLPLKSHNWDISTTTSPEIREEFQIPMLHYAAFLAYSKTDVDAYDPQKAVYHLQQFNEEFSTTSAYSETRKRRSNKRTTSYGGI